MADLKLNSSGGGSVTLTTPSTASNLTLTLPSASGTVATTTGTGAVFTNPTINGFTGDTSAITVGTNQFVKDVSGNIGIGTSSPAYKLDVVSSSDLAGRINTTGTSNSASIILQSGNGTTSGLFSYARFINNDTNAQDWRIGTYGTNNLSIVNAKAGTIPVILDTSGNLGLGVTPSAWDSGYSIMQAGIYGAAFGGRSNANTAFVMSNSVRNGNAWKFINTAAAAQLQVENGSFYWFINSNTPSAGATITYNQAMTLDVNGNLLVGTPSQSGRLTVTASTSDGTTNAYYGANSSGTLLFQVYSNGYFKTGTAASSPYNNTTASAANLYVDSGGLLYRSTSSARYKNSITDAVHGLAEVLKLRPVTYKGNNDGYTVFGGLIAEEVHDAGLTEFVQYNDDGKPDALAYGPMVSLAFKAIQELSAKNTELETRLAALEGK